MTEMKDKKVDPYKDERCCCCGAFLTEVDANTEAGWDYDLVCNNPRCRSNKIFINVNLEASDE